MKKDYTGAEAMTKDKVSRFIAANDRSPVVSGTATHVGGEGPEFVTGAHYALADGTRFVLSTDECRALPEAYPKWRLP